MEPKGPSGRPGRREGRVDPATRVFQALRIEVNSELSRLEKLLEQVIKLVDAEGRLVIISYHSGEDRIVKNSLRRLARGKIDEITGRPHSETRVIEVLTKKPVRPSPGGDSDQSPRPFGTATSSEEALVPVRRSYAVVRPISQPTFLIRERDRRRRRELLWVASILLPLGVCALGYVWLHIETLRVGYRIHALEERLERQSRSRAAARAGGGLSRESGPHRRARHTRARNGSAGPPIS